MPADVHHQVELARAADDLTPGLVHYPAVEAGLRDRGVAPVDIAAEQRKPGRRVLRVEGDIGSAGFEHENLSAGSLAEAVCHGRPGRASTDHDEIVGAHAFNPLRSA